MAETIVLYGDKSWDSPYVYSAFVALGEKGVPFEMRVLDLDRGDQRESHYQVRSLTARVPSIEHGAFALSESQAIIEYLDEAFPAPQYPRLLPGELQQRARARQILGWLRSDLLPLRDERPTTTMFFAPATAPLSDKARAAADKLLRIAEQVIPADEGHLFGAWSSADADLAFMLHRLILNGEAIPDRVRRYAVAQWSRPSVQAFVQQERPALSKAP
jgi:glutathione S-transferase